jgi:hypothetical protein
VLPLNKKKLFSVVHTHSFSHLLEKRKKNKIS